MTETVEVRDDLTRMLDEELRKLAGLASDRRAGESSLGRVRSLLRAIEAVSPQPRPAKYARHKSAILAITEYLEEAGRPVPAAELVKDLLDGGFRGGGDNARSNLLRSIGSFTGKGRLGNRTRQIKEVNGLIGLGLWPDERFIS